MKIKNQYFFLVRFTCCFYLFYPSLLLSSRQVSHCIFYYESPRIPRTQHKNRTSCISHEKMLQNSTTLNELLQYQTEVQRIGEKVKQEEIREMFVDKETEYRNDTGHRIQKYRIQKSEQRKDTFDKEAICVDICSLCTLFFLSGT